MMRSPRFSPRDNDASGSATTGVACIKHGRQFIGIERDERYFDICCRRIDETLKQGDIFAEPAKPAKQEALQL